MSYDVFFYFATFPTIDVPIQDLFSFLLFSSFILWLVRGCKMFSNILQNNNVGLTAVSSPKLPVRQSLYTIRKKCS